MRYILTLAFIMIIYVSFSRDIDTTVTLSSKNAVSNINSVALEKLNKQYSDLGKAVKSRSEKVLIRLQKQESQLKEQLQKKDSTRAQQLFANNESIYQKLRSKLDAPLGAGSPVSSLNSYIPKLDSMNIAMKFLQQEKGIQQLTSSNLQQVQAVSASLQQLQGKLQIAEYIQEFAKQRTQQLKDQLSSYGLGKQLLSLNKSVYYYQQELEQYKSVLNDNQKLQNATLNAIRQLPAFQAFIQKNSWFSQMFPMSAINRSDTGRVLTEAMTKASIEQELKQRLGSSGSDPMQYMQKQVAPSQNQLSQLQDKIYSLGSIGSSADITMPDFTPNKQKIKSFFNRLEYGFNIQSQKTNYLLPTTSQLALTVGYKLNDKSTIGIGASYNIGWGSGINDIHLTNQGVSLRSFIDIKAKRSIWITGGFEYNYLNAFSKLSDIKNLDIWQKSALIGLTKKIKIGKKSSNMQLLYDLLSQDHIPQTQPLIFRIGYSF